MAYKHFCDHCEKEITDRKYVTIRYNDHRGATSSTDICDACYFSPQEKSSSDIKQETEQAPVEAPSTSEYEIKVFKMVDTANGPKKVMCTQEEIDAIKKDFNGILNNFLKK